MSNSDDGDDTRDDADLVTAVRAGDFGALTELWHRHAVPARRYAAQVAGPSDADDLVSESFYRVVRTIAGGGGPESAFRGYLFTTIRRAHIDSVRSYRQRVHLAADYRDFDIETSPSAEDVASERDQHSTSWRAWASLPSEQRALLWQLIVEEKSPAELAPMLNTTPNGISSRAVRAKERLRQAYLQASIRSVDNADCAPVRARIGSYVRDGVSAREAALIEAHSASCAECRIAITEAMKLNRTLRGTTGGLMSVGLLCLLGGRHLSAAIRPGRLVSSSVRLKAATLLGTAAAVAVGVAPHHEHRTVNREAAAPGVAVSVAVTPTPTAPAEAQASARASRSSLSVTMSSRPHSTAAAATAIHPSLSASSSSSSSPPLQTTQARTSTSVTVSSIGIPSDTAVHSSSAATTAAPSQASPTSTEVPPLGVVTTPTATPTPTAVTTRSPAIAPETVRSLDFTMHFAGAQWIPGTLTVTTSTWQIQKLQDLLQKAGCSVTSSTTATCDVTDVTDEDTHTFELTYQTSGGPQTLDAVYRSRAGSSIAERIGIS